jgi:hypothetical protein
MSPLIKSDTGWKVDKPALAAYLITLIVGGFLTFIGSVYGWQYIQKDHEKRIGALEINEKSFVARIDANEKYVVRDQVQTEWLKKDLCDIKSLLDEIRRDQKRRQVVGDK